MLIVIGSLAVLAIAMSICAHRLPRFPGDLNLTLLFQSIHSGTFFLVMKWVSYIAAGWRSVLLVIAGSAVVLWRLGKREAILLIAAGLSSLLGFVFKIIVERPRPTIDLVQVLVVEQRNGFPSGHALFAAVFLGLMAYFTFTRLRRRSIRILTLSSLLMLILLIGASRVYLGAHWPSDVLGGYVVGVVFLGIFICFDPQPGSSL